MIKYSQFNEEEILADFIKDFGTTNKFFVEIGCHANGAISNTFLLKEAGWVGHWFDAVANPGIIQRFFTAENVNDILKEYDVPQELDFLSIDIDGNDYYLFKALTFKPRLLAIEYNIGRELDGGVQKYDPDYQWHYENSWGSCKEEMIKLAAEKGYVLYKENQANLFFVCKDLKK